MSDHVAAFDERRRLNLEAAFDQMSTSEQVAALVSLKQRLADSQAELRVEIRAGRANG
jgi:hypothetical protein